MVDASSIHTTNETFYKGRPLVAVFVGGTSGIGEFAVTALVKAYADQGSLLRLYLVGRNESAAERIIASCRQLCPQGGFIFVQASDLSSLREVDRVSSLIIQSEQTKFRDQQPRIDLLFQTQGIVTFEGRQENKEGLDITLSLIYYSRIRFITQLMPLLEKAPTSAHCVSVFGAGLEIKLFKDDLSLRNPKNNTALTRRSHIAYMTTMAFERLSRKHPGVSFAHHFPGLVLTPVFSSPDLPVWFKIIWRIAGPLAARFYAHSSEDSGQRSIFIGTNRYPARSEHLGNGSGVFSGTDGRTGSGAYAVGDKTEPVVMKKEYVQLRKDGFEDLVWGHTMDAFESIEKSGVFTK